MAVVNVCRDFEAQEKKICPASTFSPSIFHEVMGLDAMILVFLMLSFKPALSHSTFIFIQRLFSSSSLSAIRMATSAHLRLSIFLLAIFIPACDSSSPAFCMIHLACVFAKSLQSSPTLCNLVDCSLPGFSVHGILQARILSLWSNECLQFDLFAFSKLSLYVWKFSVGIAFWDWNNWPFPDLWPLLSFPNFLKYWG